MKSHDLAQFVFNNSILNLPQIDEVIKAARSSNPSLAAAALFLQFVSVDELDGTDDDSVKSLLTPKQLSRISELKDGKSLNFAQALVDMKIVDFARLEKIFDQYNNLEIPPVESALTTYYETFKKRYDVDFPFAVEIVRSFHSFLSETLDTSIVILPSHIREDKQKPGASVKIDGEIPAVVALYAEESIFIKLAARYDSYVEISEDANDAVAELLNVFTGQFTVNIAVRRGLEEVPEPPRCGNIFNNLDGIAMISDFGTFYVYIGKDEIFDKR